MIWCHAVRLTSNGRGAYFYILGGEKSTSTGSGVFERIATSDLRDAETSSTLQECR